MAKILKNPKAYVMPVFKKESSISRLTTKVWRILIVFKSSLIFYKVGIGQLHIGNIGYYILTL
jgi:hypothetical protein